MAEDFLTNFQYSRQQQRYTTLSGVTPSMPVLTGATMTGYTEADNMVLGNFLDTDLLKSEIFLNASDDRVFIRSNDTILEFLMSGSTGSTYTNGNGITIGTGNTINLGGTLTQPTVISGNSQTFDLGVTSSELSFLRIKSIQAQENYTSGGLGLEVTKNPGTFLTELDYTSAGGIKTRIQQNPNNISISVSSNSGNTTSTIIQTPGIINILTNSDESTLSPSGLILDQSSNSFRFDDNRAVPKGLEYPADYSATYTSLSLITKGDLDNAITGITDDNYYTTGSTLIGNTVYFNRNDTLSAYTADLSSITFSGGSGNCISDLYVTNIYGCSPITVKDELIIESGITGTGNIDITGNVISDIVQLRGGVGTQGEMSWSADEETVQLIMDGTTLFLGQDTFVHVRNNTASIITKGTAVYATGTLGASGRITVAPMIANGTIPGRLFIGLAAENIAIGADGQVCSYGKIRQINTTAYNDGDVLWLSPTVAGQLTATEPTAPNLKIATAFVVHDANNGTLFVRAEQGTDLHTDQRVQVSGLTDGDVLAWSNANQRWENEAPTGGGGHEIYNGTDVTPLPQRAGLRFTGYLEAVDDAGNDESVVDLSSTAITPTEISRFDENGSGNIDLKIAENKLLTGDINGFATELTFAQEGILGLDVNNEVKEFEVVEIYNILKEDAVTGNKQLALLDINGTSANIKAKFEISAIAIQNITANAVTINIGSASLGTNVANTVVIGANATLKLPLGTTFFSITSGQNLFISSGSWNSASININITISKIWQ